MLPTTVSVLGGVEMLPALTNYHLPALHRMHSREQSPCVSLLNELRLGLCQASSASRMTLKHSHFTPSKQGSGHSSCKVLENFPPFAFSESSLRSTQKKRIQLIPVVLNSIV